MISIEAHRASIGRYFDKCKRLSNIDEFNSNESCFFSVYLNYLVLHFNNIFGVFLLEFYDSTFLKRMQLLIDGDVESNPGPTQNQDGKSPMSGRPKKIKSFKGTPNKQKKCVVEDIDFNISYNVREPSVPLGLLNQGENVCFFNSIVQVLYSLPAFRDFMQQILPTNAAVLAIQNLFREISCSNVPVRTSRYVQNLGLSDYEVGMQYDAHECLLLLLNKIYPVINDCIFKVVKLETTVCENNDCGHAINKEDTSFDWSLNVKDARDFQTISGILNELMDPRGRAMPDYRCDECSIAGSSTKAVCVTHLSEVLIIQLSIFKFIDNTTKKIIPNLIIDEEISLWGNTMTLHAIVYHEGEQSNSGHYTSGVKMNNTWFMISDLVVLNQQKLTCSERDSSVPYILIYKKRSDVITFLPNSSNDRSDNNPAISTTQINTESTSEMMNRQSVLNELDKQKARMDIVDEKKEKENVSDKTSLPVKQNLSQNEGLSKVKSPVKRKLKYSNVTSSKRMCSLRDNLDDSKKNEIKDDDKKRKKEMRDNKLERRTLRPR